MATTARDTEEKNTADQAKLIGLDYLDIRQLSGRPLYPEVINNDDRSRFHLVPLMVDAETISFGVTTQTPSTIFGQFEQRFNQHRVSFVLISETSFKEYQTLYNPPVKLAYQEIRLSDDSQANLTAVAEAIDGVRSDDLFAYIVQQANRLQASDIHFECAEFKTLIRFRVFGVLHPIVELNSDQYRILVNTIASDADLSTAAQKPQTGRISQSYRLQNDQVVVVNLRIETAPTVHGTDIVMRLFDLASSLLDLDKLGFDSHQRQVIDQIIHRPSGLVLMVGPTGSGKTTTLYGVVNQLNNSQRKIITLENPIEFQVPGLVQIPTTDQDQDSFAQGLKAVLRLDPDIIMIGEIRDEDTARTALQAALTGHLVLSTYHAPSTASALIRILDGMAGNYLFLNALRLVTGQRLIRRLDQKTKIAYRPASNQLQQLKKMTGRLPEAIRPAINWSQFRLYRPGQSPDHPFGYDGRLPLRELLLVDDQLRNFLADHNLVVTTDQINQVVFDKSSQATLLDDGLLKILAGQTSLEEVYRVLG